MSKSRRLVETVSRDRVVQAAYRRGSVIHTGSSHPLILDKMISQGVFPGIMTWEQFEQKFPDEETFSRIWKPGFVTATGRFLTREQAAQQLNKLPSRDDGASAEDFGYFRGTSRS
jgi:hypothetical protein